MNEITYSRNGDYLIPDLKLTPQPTQPKVHTIHSE
ncbi:TnpV protein [Anaerotignum neopropionicum]|nr:TnpV protein [Anaerotignum neopropionicum]